MTFVILPGLISVEAEKQAMLENITTWYTRQLQTPHAGHRPGTKLVMGTSVWGEPYTFDFSLYCLPSIIAADNRKALDAARWSLVLYVDEESKRRLKPRLEAHHVPVLWRDLPADVVEACKTNATWKYPLLAAIHNILIHEAASIGAGFHMLVADCVYSSRYFASLQRLSHHGGIPHTGCAVQADDALPVLERYRQNDGTLKIPARCLGQIGWDHLVPEWRGWVLDTDDFTSLPDAHYLYLPGRDRIHIHSAHQTAAWIAPDRCRRVTAELGGTVDSELPRYMGLPFHQPAFEDDMVFLVLARNDSRPPGRITLPEFARAMWQHTGGHPEYGALFRAPCVVPLAQDNLFQPDAATLVRRIDTLCRQIRLP